MTENNLQEEDVCVSCQNTEKILRDHLTLKGSYGKYPENLIKKIAISPCPGVNLGEIILCIWCQGYLYSALKSLDKDYENNLNKLKIATEKVVELFNILT